MVECKDCHKDMTQLHWEHQMMEMQIEDYLNEARDIHMFRLSDEHQDVSVIRILKHNTVFFVFLIWISFILNQILAWPQ